MISTEECRRHLGEDLTDRRVEKLRDTLYALVENVIDDYINPNLETLCKKPSYTAESHLNGKKLKVMA